MIVRNPRAFILDLSKIKETKSNTYYRISQSKNTKEQKKYIANFFNEVFKEIIGGNFTFSKKRFVSYKRNGRCFTKKIDSDINRLWQAYLIISRRYGCGTDMFSEYLEDSIKSAITEYNIDKPSKLIGFVTSEMLIDKYFLNRKKNNINEAKILKFRNRVKEHANIFNSK